MFDATARGRVPGAVGSTHPLTLHYCSTAKRESTMDHATISKGMAIAALCTVAAASNTRAADAVFVASSISSQSSIETQGFAGRISLRTAPFGSAPSRDVLGATASDQMIYQLESTFGTSSSVIRGTTTHPGGGQLSITVNRPLSDIALIGSTLYGIINRSDAVEIVSIAPNGVLTPVVNYPITTYNGRWRLSGQVGGGALLAVRARTGSSLPADAYGALFDPSSGSLLSQLSIATQDTSTPVNRGAVADTVIAANGASFTALPADSFFAISPAPQPVYLLPSAAPQGNRPADQRYASTSINAMAVSDEFHYAFGPENDALADVSAVYSGQWGRLYRHPFVW
ncbi:MAG TPA: hypothetical protein VNL70_09730, partial [Tepidisphaeraceae bacterium]|nr:hypothetical protein [Tepidisphaeraceae bacterium]